MKKIVLLAALSLAACGPQQPYPQQQAQRQCDPQSQDCYGFGVGRDSHGDALVAGVVGAAAGYAARGYMDRNRDRDYDRDYDRSYSRDYDRDREYRRDRPRTVVVNKYYGGTAPVASTASRTVSKPPRTMFKSARRK